LANKYFKKDIVVLSLNFTEIIIALSVSVWVSDDLE